MFSILILVLVEVLVILLCDFVFYYFLKNISV